MFVHIYPTTLYRGPLGVAKPTSNMPCTIHKQIMKLTYIYVGSRHCVHHRSKAETDLPSLVPSPHGGAVLLVDLQRKIRRLVGWLDVNIYISVAKSG